MTNFTLANFQWAVPGRAVKNYQQIFTDTNTFSIEEDLTNMDYTTNPISFYWINGGTNLEVDCTATVRGMKVSGKAYFNVNRPVGILTTITTTNIPPVNIITNDDGSMALQYGTATTNFAQGNEGIYFSFSATTPTNGSGSIGLVQIVSNTTRRWILDDTNNTAQKSSGTNLLDTTPFGPVTHMSAIIGNSQTVSNFFADSPGQGFYQVVNGVRQDFKWASADDSFTDYLMYRPSGDTSSTIWVTLCKVDWHWSGAATKGTNNVWTVDSGYPAPPINPTGVDSAVLPAWNSVSFLLPTVPDN